MEKFEGDLDEHFANDRMAALLARLTYSREDERSGREPRHSITFSTGANMREGTAALAGAVRLYLRFRDDVSGSTDPLLPSPSVPVSVVPGLIVIETPTRRRARYGGYPIGDGQNLVIRNILSNLGEETLSENDWKNTKQYFANKCAYCGTEGLLVIDHAVPINKAKLGEHRIGNLVPSCADCNNGKRKGGKDFIEYLSSQFSPVSEEESRERIKGNRDVYG